MVDRVAARVRTWPYRVRPEWALDHARRMADNRKTCSGACCGNPRRWWKVERLTLQEKGAEDAFRAVVDGELEPA